MGQGNPLGMYPGLGPQSMSGQVNQRQSMQGGFGGNPNYGFGMGNGMDNMSSQRAMFESSHSGQMQQQLPNHPQSNNGPYNQSGFGNGGGMNPNMSSGGNVTNGGGGPNTEWMGNNYNRPDLDTKKEEEQQQQQHQQFRA
jgi:hypothetical protein